MKLWVGTGIIADVVDIFFVDKPGPEEWIEREMPSPPHSSGYWKKPEYGFIMDRGDARGEFVTLPTHGTKELIEYEICGNGRMAE